MVSILDIAPSGAKAITVSVRGQDVNVQGLSIADIAYLIQHFPEVRDMFAGKDVSFTFDTLLTRAPQVVYAIIACGTGQRLSGDALDIIKGLSIEEQVDLLDAILKETFKGGLGPFVEKVTRVLGAASDLGTKASDSSGPKQPST